MVFSRIRENWKKRAKFHLIRNAKKKDWCTFAKALCGSWKNCSGFPNKCKCCFDGYFNTAAILERIIEQ
ncbi:MAG: hypothetical protein ACFFCQ_18885 [Promethearchaeota archaeon]